MRVICIDDNPRGSGIDPDSLKKLIEGEEYTAYPSPHPYGCFIKEVPTKNPLGFYMDRFIQLSSIDETQMTRENIKELTNHSIK